ncbi:hypothetical protein KP509_06G073400 [Ceratopteris richardii]|uniref:Uncharacterized protein n=1 Tax=Ceratopteris richardii TaxID=49495 RepID=A0A8T2UP38_CERRI|nr:hypothetical protein KP509_06G073400 [Ceratopteris richardii]
MKRTPSFYLHGTKSFSFIWLRIRQCHVAEDKLISTYNVTIPAGKCWRCTSCFISIGMCPERKKDVVLHDRFALPRAYDCKAQARFTQVSSQVSPYSGSQSFPYVGHDFIFDSTMKRKHTHTPNLIR